jgi:hypothetical protein
MLSRDYPDGADQPLDTASRQRIDWQEDGESKKADELNGSS